MGRHNCTAVGCKLIISTAKLMCPAHWGKVPADLQREVYATFRAYEKACDGDEGVEASKRAYYNARGEAIAAVARAEGRFRDSVCVFIPRGDRFAVIRLAKHEHRPEVPGGKLLAGETHEAAARREVLEKIGVELLTAESVTSLYVRIPSRGELHRCEVFAGTVAADAELRGSDEGPAGWVTREDLLEHGTYKQHNGTLLRAVDAHVARKVGAA